MVPDAHRASLLLGDRRRRHHPRHPRARARAHPTECRVALGEHPPLAALSAERPQISLLRQQQSDEPPLPETPHPYLDRAWPRTRSRHRAGGIRALLPASAYIGGALGVIEK